MITEKLKNLILLIISLLFTLYVCNIIIYFIYTDNQNQKYTKIKNGGYTPSFCPYYYNMGLSKPMIINDKTYIPLGGIPKVNTIYCKENSDWVTYESDRFGFENNDHVYEAILSSKGKSALLVGDSFAQGACVQIQNTTQSILTNNGIPSISIGMGGNSPLIELAGLKEYFNLIGAKYVIWLYYEGNDIPQVRSDKEKDILSHYLNNQNNLPTIEKNRTIVNEEIRKLIELEKDKFEKNKRVSSNEIIYNLISLKYLYSYLKNILFIEKMKCEWDEIDIKKEEFDFFYKIINTAKKFTEKNKSQFIFIYLPSIQSYTNNCNYAKQNIIASLKKNGIYIYDFSEIINKENYSNFFAYGNSGGHYNEYGYSKLAEYISNIIKNN